MQAGRRRFESGHLHQDARITANPRTSHDDVRGSLTTESESLECSQAIVLRRTKRRGEGCDGKECRGQATKGERRMPWRREAMKDVASCEKPWGAASRPRSTDVRMGEPGRGHARSWRAESIGARTRTEGTETSQYLEEKKSTEMAPVAASDRARA